MAALFHHARFSIVVGRGVAQEHVCVHVGSPSFNRHGAIRFWGACIFGVATGSQFFCVVGLRACVPCAFACFPFSMGTRFFACLFARRSLFSVQGFGKIAFQWARGLISPLPPWTGCAFNMPCLLRMCSVHLVLCSRSAVLRFIAIMLYRLSAVVFLSVVQQTVLVAGGQHLFCFAFKGSPVLRSIAILLYLLSTVGFLSGVQQIVFVAYVQHLFCFMFKGSAVLRFIAIMLVVWAQLGFLPLLPQWALIAQRRCAQTSACTFDRCARDAEGSLASIAQTGQQAKVMLWRSS